MADTRDRLTRAIMAMPASRNIEDRRGELPRPLGVLQAEAALAPRPIINVMPDTTADPMAQALGYNQIVSPPPAFDERWGF